MRCHPEAGDPGQGRDRLRIRGRGEHPLQIGIELHLLEKGIEFGLGTIQRACQNLDHLQHLQWFAAGLQKILLGHGKAGRMGNRRHGGRIRGGRQGALQRGILLDPCQKGFELLQGHRVGGLCLHA